MAPAKKGLNSLITQQDRLWGDLWSHCGTEDSSKRQGHCRYGRGVLGGSPAGRAFQMESPIEHLIICSFLANLNIDARVILLKYRLDHVPFLLKIFQWFPVSLAEKNEVLTTVSELIMIISRTSHPYTMPLVCSTPATFLSLEYTAAASGPLHWLFLCLNSFSTYLFGPLPHILKLC